MSGSSERNPALAIIEVEVCPVCRGVGHRLEFTRDRKAVIIVACENCGSTGATAKLANQ